MRGGTSKGVYFAQKDLPQGKDLDAFLLRIMGSPDKRQIDGLGGASPLTSKVALISPSTRDGVDLDYKFAQVYVDKPLVDTSPTCGNILTAVGCFGIENGMVDAQDGVTLVKVYDENTGFTVEQLIQTPGRKVLYDGNCSIAGVPGTAAPIAMSFVNIVGAKTGRLFPTGNKIDKIDGFNLSCIDVAMPTVFFRASELGLTGYESKEELDSKEDVIQKMLEVRRKASILMGLGEVEDKVIPKLAIVTSPQSNGAQGNLCGRYFTPFSCHDAFALSASFAAATGSAVPGTILNELALGVKAEAEEEQQFILQHPAGTMEIGISFVGPEDVKTKVVRTARMIMRGEVAI